MSAYYTQSGGNTLVAANPGVGLGGSTFSPSGSAQFPGHHQQPQPGAVATPTPVGGAHLFQGMPGVPGNGYGLGLPEGNQGAVTTYPPFKRKAIRAAQACDACRARKAKCDEGRPSCGFCTETAIPCVYREVPPPKQDRTLLEILNRLGRIEGLLDAQNNGSNAETGASVANATALNRALDSMTTLANAATSAATMTNTPGGVSSQTTTLPQSASVPQPQNVSRVNPSAKYPPSGPTSNPAGQMLEEDEELTIPYQHTTAAHKLLLWPSIRNLIDEVVAEDEGYIMQAEECRGSLRIWGRGENAGIGEMFDEGEDPEAACGVTCDGLQGRWMDPGGGGFSGEAVDDDETHGVGSGGLNPDGALKLDPDTVFLYLNSYLSNIHILHPILDKNTISRTTREFLARVNPPPPQPPVMTSSPTSACSGLESHAGHTRKSSISSNVIGKRKRAISISGGAIHEGSTQGRINSRNNSTSHPSPPHIPQHLPPRRQNIPRTIHSAIVLLVMALGSVCLHRQPVPGPLIPIATSSPKNAFISPPAFNQGGSTSTPTIQSAGTPPGTYPHNPYGSQAPPSRPPPRMPKKFLRNIDIIPGLAYFTKAMEIMGILFGGNELENVQAGLLTGLYWGQLGRVLDSWKWISWACMGCQVLVRMHEKDEVRKDVILRLFWSCLQLESDVLAELDLPPSGISRLEDSMPLPSGLSTDPIAGDLCEDDPLMWMYYLAQIALRKLLNRAHTALYKQHVGRTIAETNRSLNIARELDFQLEQWRKTLPVPLRWDESDPPSTDINAARLRAKYFGARYIIHRPFVYQAVHGLMGSASSPAMSTSETSGSPREGTPSAGAAARISSAAGDLSEAGGSVGVGTGAKGDQSLEASCRKCIEAAISSTTSFHAFSASSHRPVITNVFGTAHAQFGNLLVLSAAFLCPTLKHLIPSQLLHELFSKTIFFLRTLSPISAALGQDLLILEHTAAKLELKLDEYNQA